MINQTYIQPYIPLGILVVFIIMDLIYIASKHGQNTSPYASPASQRSISSNPFLQTYFPTIVLIVVIIISLLVMFSILGIDFNKKLPEHVSKVVTYNSVI